MQSKECPFSSTLGHGPSTTNINDFFFFLKKEKKKKEKKDQRGFLEVEWWGVLESRGVKSQCSAFWRVRKGI